MKMLTTDELRAAAHQKVDKADDAMLISILEASPEEDATPPRLSETELRRIHDARQRRIDGEKGYTLDEIIADYKSRLANVGL